MSSEELAAEQPEQYAETSFWRRLCYTPMRDVLRGHISGRLDIESIIAGGNLPSSLAGLVRVTVNRTRLWRSEQIDVANELVAHFQDGVLAGASADSLQSSFGDPRAAARLIRRAKLRNRPLAWKLMVRTTKSVGTVVGVVALIYGLLLSRVYFSSPTISHDYVAELNARILATPEDQRAWPLYRQAILMTNKVPSTDDEPAHLRPGSEEWEAWRTYLDENADSLALMREAAARPYAGAPYRAKPDRELLAHFSGSTGPIADTGDDSVSESPALLFVTLPFLRVYRTAGHMLAMDALIAAQRGDGGRVHEDLAALFSLAEHARDSGFLISDLVSLAILRSAMDVVGTLLDSQPGLLSSDQLVFAAHRLATVDGGGPLRLRLDIESLVFDDCVQRIYTDDGHGDGHLTGEGLTFMMLLVSMPSQGGSSETTDVLARLSSPLGAGRKDVVELHRKLMAMTREDAAVPLWKRDGSHRSADEFLVELQQSQLNTTRFAVIHLLFPSFNRASLVAEYTTQRRDAILAAIACELYRRHTGNWPASLDDLVPLYLPVVPRDRYDGGPLKYCVADGKPLLYSIGVDRDDDGGRAAERVGPLNNKVYEWVPPKVAANPEEYHTAIPEGDWILWPPTEQ